MSRKKKPLPLLENIKIESCAAEGKSLFHWNDLVVFIPYCVPGDIVDVQIKRKKHSYAEGEVVRFVQYSETRSVPRCQHFGICGGCKWQNLPYEEQLKMKQQQVTDQLSRIGKIPLPPTRTILGSEKQWAYRNKLDFGASNRRYLTKEEIQSGSEFQRDALGFHITGAFDKILPITKCHLMDDLHNQIRNDIFSYAVEHGFSFFDLRAQTGFLRDVIIRNSNSGEWMVIVMFHYNRDENGVILGSEEEKAKNMLQYIADKYHQISSLLYLDNQKCNDTIGDQDILVFKGNDHIIEQMEDLKFKVGPKSFYQTNTEQAHILYSVVRDFAFKPIEGEQAFEDKPLVYDLYTGTGTIACFVSKRAKKVIGIEYVPEAIQDAKVNASINNIHNTLFYAGDMKDVLTDDFVKEHGQPDIIITDPPRAGMHPDVINTIIETAPKRIVYVSCNPATQARDLQLLGNHYQVLEVQPVDMFPHTPHVENVVLLKKITKTEVTEQ